MNINIIVKYTCITLWVIVMVIIYTYFMIHNAFWLGGDEAIVMNTTGWGHAFIPPREPFSIGRFFPLSYNLYNILLLFPHGAQVSVTCIYVLQAVALCVFSVIIWIMSVQIAKNLSEKWRYPISLFAVIFAVSRVYSEFITCYTGVWIVFTMLPIFLFCAWRFSETTKMVYAFVALMIVNYIIYCYETVFTVPLAIGAVALIFNYQELSKKERWFYACLIGSAILFLVLYILLVMPRTVVAYDGAHGQDISVIGNAIHIFIAQKTMWVVAILLVFRVFDCIRHRKKINFFDYLLLASCAYCCGAAALKLNFIYYYNAAVLVAIPSIVYFSINYLKPSRAFILLLLFACFYGVKMPKMITDNQAGRIEYYNYSEMVANYIKQGERIYWYCPDNSDTSEFDLADRSWKRGYTQSIIAWQLWQENYQIPVCESFSKGSGLWFVVDSDVNLFLESADYADLMFDFGGIKCYRTEDCQK